MLCEELSHAITPLPLAPVVVTHLLFPPASGHGERFRCRKRIGNGP